MKPIHNYHRAIVASATAGELLCMTRRTHKSIEKYFNSVGYLDMDLVFDDLSEHVLAELENSLEQARLMIEQTKKRLVIQPSE